MSVTRPPRRNPRITPAEIAASAVVNLRSLVSGSVLDKSPTLTFSRDMVVIWLTLTKLKIMRKKWDIPPPRPNIRLSRGRGGRLGMSPWHKIAVERERCSSGVEENDETKRGIGQHPSKEKVPE